MGAALALAGCVMPADNQQMQNDNQDLRGIVAADRQQINALQDQVARLNDHISEVEHNRGGGGADQARIAQLEREIQQLKSGNPAVNLAPPGFGAPLGTAPGGPMNPGGAPNGYPGFAGPGGAAGPPPGPVAYNNDTSMNAMSGAENTGDDDNAEADDDNSSDEDNSPDAGNNPALVASNAPVPAAQPPRPATAPRPASVANAPSWRAHLAQEIAAARSSNEAGAKVYRAGLTDMKAGKFANAIGVFQKLQRGYPKSPLSEPAEYFSAIALYQMGKYDQSILQFNDLVMRFPRGRFASAALLNEAQAFMKMNDLIDARLTLQKLIGEHPDAAEAPTARAMMNSLANG
jgi:TolA-binding protein